MLKIMKSPLSPESLTILFWNPSRTFLENILKILNKAETRCIFMQYNYTMYKFSPPVIEGHRCRHAFHARIDRRNNNPGQQQFYNPTCDYYYQFFLLTYGVANSSQTHERDAMYWKADLLIKENDDADEHKEMTAATRISILIINWFFQYQTISFYHQSYVIWSSPVCLFSYFHRVAQAQMI